jgi:N-acetylglutamate synthase-like GNAT family acetyltransferase
MVRRDHHRRGIGTLLLAHRVAEIARAGLEEIEMVTSQHSKPFFARAGFVDVEVQVGLFAPGLHGHRMRRGRL